MLLLALIKNKERQTKAAPRTPAKGPVEQRKADAPIKGAWSKRPLLLFKSQLALVGGFLGNSNLTHTRQSDCLGRIEGLIKLSSFGLVVTVIYQ